jgi:hypothetical protein
VGGRINFKRKPTTLVRRRGIQNNGLATAESCILYANRGSHVGYWGLTFLGRGFASFTYSATKYNISLSNITFKSCGILHTTQNQTGLLSISSMRYFTTL